MKCGGQVVEEGEYGKEIVVGREEKSPVWFCTMP